MARGWWSADIPPLACAAARAAGLPVVALGNFTWDWIYEGYRRWLPPHSDLIERLGDAYALADVALRLPMHGGFSTMKSVIDLPFIARRSSKDPQATRAQLGLPPDRPLVLLSFGGYGLQRIDLNAVAGLERYLIVVTADVTTNRRENEVPSGAGVARLPPNVRLVDEQALYAGGMRYEDLVAAVDVVMTKPGYGIIAECVANDTAIVYTSRGHFVEYDVLVAGDAALAALRVHLERCAAGRRMAAGAGRHAGSAAAARDDCRRRRRARRPARSLLACRVLSSSVRYRGFSP